MKFRLAAAALLASLTGAASVPAVSLAMSTPPTPQQQMNVDRCFKPADIDSFKVGANNVVNLRLDGGAYYQLTLRDPCQGLDMERAMLIEGRSGSSYACNGEDINILTRSPAVPSGRCNVQSFRKLSAQEAAALPQKEKP